jgi:hypothetical protein
MELIRRALHFSRQVMIAAKISAGCRIHHNIAQHRDFPARSFGI